MLDEINQKIPELLFLKALALSEKNEFESSLEILTSLKEKRNEESFKCEFEDAIKYLNEAQIVSKYEKVQIYSTIGLYDKKYIYMSKEICKDIDSEVLVGECEMNEGYLLLKEGRLKEGIELLML